MTVAIDWGSTSFRAFHFDSEGNLLNQYQGEHGIKQAQGLASKERKVWFERTLLEICRDWIEADRKFSAASDSAKENQWVCEGSENRVDVVLSGMVTSRNGWIETPYINCPLVLDDLRKHSVNHNVDGIELAFLPGVSVNADHPDVMRGEELQLIGVDLHSTDCHSVAANETENRQVQTIFVLPGTHSKWVSCRSSGSESLAIESFHTCPTGEVFDSLLNHTLIGGLAVEGDWSETMFATSVKTGYSSQRFLSSLFAARSGVLLESLDASAVPAYLSGMLIGREIREGMDVPSAFALDKQSSKSKVSLVLIGEPQLCQLYLRALQTLEIPATVAGEDMSAAGFKKLLGY